MRFLVVLVLLTACGETTQDDPGSGDASAQLACRDFYDVAAEADLMNDAELRGRLQDLWNTAEISATPGIAESARAMLETVTSGDIDAFEGAVGDMEAACANVEPL